METPTTDRNIEIKIARCDPYPLIEPQGYVVGFIVYCMNNGKSMYRDVLVSFLEMAKAQGAMEEDGSSSNASEDRNMIVDIAYDKIKDGVSAWYDTVCKTPVLLGSCYKPKA